MKTISSFIGERLFTFKEEKTAAAACHHLQALRDMAFRTLDFTVVGGTEISTTARINRSIFESDLQVHVDREKAILFCVGFACGREQEP